jgi:hypothetical protein
MVVLPETDASPVADDSFDVEAAIADFLEDPKQLSLELPHMSTGQRRRARKLAEDSPELTCESYGFGSDRKLHLFKEGFEDKPSKPLKPVPDMSVKNMFIEAETSPNADEGLEAALRARSLRLAATNAAAAAAANGRTLTLWPAGLQPEVRNTFIDFAGDSMDERIIQTMPRDMFRQRLNHESSVAAPTEPPSTDATRAAECGSPSKMCLGGLSSLPPPPTQPAPAGLTPCVEPPFPACASLLTPGTQIMVEGLVKAPAFNGLAGVLQFYEQETNRYSVLLASPFVAAGVQTAKLKGENLRLIAPPPYCAMGAKEPSPVASAVATPLRLTALV